MRKKAAFVLFLICICMLAVSLGCSRKVKNIAQSENNRYNMADYQKGNQRAKNAGHGLNTAFLSKLKSEFGREGMPLTHETYAEGTNGHISYSYFINGDPRHFVIAHAFPSEEMRVRKMAEMYSGLEASGNAHHKASNASVLYARSNTALVYASQAEKTGPFSKRIERIFRLLMGSS
ncbi:hypothetical protein [Paenibacillus sp. J22TS3]|uniref:hypothetical protein n=1 Tax=Paenibacillus sp. J22TS3 TaxID=2807192 RepID=UPI001AFE40C4|nr:hypothetical protein [Paenibacillus sp. J22TS3]GIP21521.1 hypothetical protein J22TS3_17960 [Paenibacillus sp. J22TS3]